MKRHGALITPVRAYGARWGFDDYFTTGKRVQVRRATKTEAIQAHSDLSVLMANGRKDLTELKQDELAEFRAWKLKATSTVTVKEASGQLLASKLSEREVGTKWLIKLEEYLNVFAEEFGAVQVTQLTAPEISRWLARLPSSPRTRNNLRAAIVQLFRWCKANRYLPDDAITEAERVKKLKIRKPETILTWTPEEMQQRLYVCTMDELPAQVIGAFAGVRPEELRPQYPDKSPLAWDDFDWDEKIIHLRSDTSKVNEARHIPILPVLDAWLQPFKNRYGPCCKQGRTCNSNGAMVIAKLSGIPHKRNANRHSFITYWMAIHKDIGRCSEECGTSIYKIKANYKRPANLRIANAYFNLYPRDQSKLIEFEAHTPIIPDKVRPISENRNIS
jgi:integrase